MLPMKATGTVRAAAVAPVAEPAAAADRARLPTGTDASIVLS